MDIYFLNNSSHGAGVFGFGGDDSGTTHILSITGIKNQLRKALDNNNVPRFSIIGFDACVMQSWSVLGELSTVTDYVLASVALEPGHGWDYQKITSNSSDTVEYAKQIIDGFVDGKHGYYYHVGNKTLSLVSTRN